MAQAVRMALARAYGPGVGDSTCVVGKRETLGRDVSLLIES